MIHELIVLADLELIVANDETGQDEVKVVGEADQNVKLLEPAVRRVDHVALTELLAAGLFFLAAP